jgi:hypothetical protein
MDVAMEMVFIGLVLYFCLAEIDVDGVRENEIPTQIAGICSNGVE